jgi:transcriptional regulator with XRE-family HTH domain
MTRYTFAELLTVFFHLHQDLEIRKTQAELAAAVGVSRRTLSSWFAGDYLPRSPEAVLRVAQALCLTAFQADLLLYAVDASWVRYGTPAAVLEAAEILRYREEEVAADTRGTEAVPSLAQIQEEWPVIFADRFERNYRRWGVGVKENGMGRLLRTLGKGTYELSLENHYHEDLFLGGDSACFAPKLYFWTVQARLVHGEHRDDGYGLMFEELSDEAYAFLRIRESKCRASVIQTFNGGDQATVFLRRVPAPALQPGEWNRLAILAIFDEHWFYVNGALIGHKVIPRLPYARLDVGIVAAPGQQVVCQFRDFCVQAPAEEPSKQ